MAARFLRLVNPLARWLIAAGMPTGAPNILLTVLGRRSGTPRTVPVSMLELDGRRFVQASYGVTGWAVNLRAAGEAIITDHGGRVPVQAVELPPEQAAAVLRRGSSRTGNHACCACCSAHGGGRPSACSGATGSASTTRPRTTLPRRSVTPLRAPADAG
ncbi:MAG TPA: hypothetical protein DEV93_17240 [Chloroflexi bacterium]|nr:hypothetical protein [Chloroflexota bacterium]